MCALRVYRFVRCDNTFDYEGDDGRIEYYKINKQCVDIIQEVRYQGRTGG